MDIVTVHSRLRHTFRNMLPVKCLFMVLLIKDITHNNNKDKKEKIETRIINCLVSLS